MAVYTRKALAEKTGFGFDALRYYENRGVIPAPVRSASNYRLYGEDAVERLLFIKQAKRCGFTQSEIARALELIGSADACPASIDEVIDEKVSQIEERMLALAEMKRMLIGAKESLRGRDFEKLGSFIDLAP